MPLILSTIYAGRDNDKLARNRKVRFTYKKNELLLALGGAVDAHKPAQKGCEVHVPELGPESAQATKLAPKLG